MMLLLGYVAVVVCGTGLMWWALYGPGSRP
jgi:hypothetical protein